MADETAQQLGTAILVDLIHGLHQGEAAEDFFAQIARVNQLSLPGNEKASLIECVRMAMAIRNRLELQQQREKGLLAVIESAQDLSSHLDLIGLLRAIVARARNLLGAHVAWFSFYNPEADEMQAQVTDGAIFRETTTMTTKRHLGSSSIVFATKMPFTTTDYLSDQRFQHDPKLDAIFRNEGVAALVGVPLLLENEVVGLLFVADRYHRSHTALEVSILSTLATHAAVAIRNAKTFDLTHQALQKGDIARAALEIHARNVQSASEAHQQLTAMLAQGASLSQLCNRLAEQLEGDILVLDEALQIICRGQAHGNGEADLARFDPYGDRRSAIESAVHESRKTDRSVVAYETEGVVCRVVSITGGSEMIGSILLFTRTDARELSIRIFERSTSVIGIVLVSQERLEIHRNRDAAALLRGLLLSHQYEWASTRERAEQFGLELAQPLSLLLIESDALKGTYIARRLRTLPSLSGVVLDEMDECIAIVCKTPAAQDVVQTCTRLLAGELGIECRGVLSRPTAVAEQLTALYATLRRALFVARRLGAKGILHQHELALYSVLLESQDKSSIDAFLESSLGALLSHDRRKDADLAGTLLCFLDANRNARVVAKRMGIHVNTVRQRLATIETLLGHLGNPTRALELHMALRLWALSRPERTEIDPAGRNGRKSTQPDGTDGNRPDQPERTEIDPARRNGRKSAAPAGATGDRPRPPERPGIDRARRNDRGDRSG